MKYGEFKKMMDRLHSGIRQFYQTNFITANDAILFGNTMAEILWLRYGRSSWNKTAFYKAVSNTVQNEILRACA